MECKILGITILDLWGMIVGGMIGGIVGEVPFAGAIIECGYDFIMEFVGLGWGCVIEIPKACIWGLTRIDASFYKGMGEFPAVLLDLILHLFGKA